MQLNRCPSCHSRISIEQMVQDKNGSDLFAVFFDLPEGMGRTLAVYLGLFKSAKRDLANDRALKLATQTLALTNDKARLAMAMEDTINAIRLKQDDGNAKPLSNHNYLKRVLENVPAQVSHNTDLSPVITPVKQQVTSKTGQAMVALEEFKRGE